MAYARTTASLKCTTTAGTITLPSDTEIKGVKIEGERYVFDARVRSTGAWVRASFAGDLPAFTDKGQAHRAAHRADKLVHGRPRVSSDRSSKRLVAKVTEEQYAWAEREASRKEQTISQFLRARLISDGMPE